MTDRRERLINARNYALYYGKGNEESLKKFDIVIIEPSAQDDNSVKAIKDSGTLVIAYLSAVEINRSDPMFSLLKSDDFVMVNGKPAYNKVYDNYLADLRSPRWNNLIMHKAGKLLVQSGYDGLFLDTIGNVESKMVDEGSRDGLIMSALGFIKQLKQAFEGRLVIQNNGLESLCLYTGNVLDGICWENPPFDRKESVLWAESVADRLSRITREYGARVFLLFEDDERILKQPDYAYRGKYKQIGKLAEKNNFLVYVAPNGYVKEMGSPWNR